MQSVFDLIEKEKTKSVFDMVEEPKKQDLPKAEDFKSVFELVQQNKPKQPIQDIAQISPEPVQSPTKPVMGTAGYVGGKVYSTLIEKPVAAMAAPVSSALEKGFRLFGFDTLADQQKKVTELYNAPPVTSKVQEQTSYLREQAYGKGMLQGVGFDVTESVTQLMGLLTQMAATKKIPALKGKDIMDTFKVMAGHAVATTPGGVDDRLKAAVYRMGYSMTPFIANSTGATGLTAVAVDTALNTFLTSPTYMKAFKEAENPEQFFQMAIPQLIMDIGMAWNTRGLPANQRIAEYNKMWNKVENQVLKLKPEEFAKLAEEVDKVYQEQQKMETKTETKEPWEMTEEKFVKENINKSEVGLKDIQNNEVKLNKIEQPTTEKPAEVETEPTGVEAKREDIAKKTADQIERELTKQADDKLDELLAKGLSWEEANNHPEVDAIHSSINNLMESEYEKHYKNIEKIVKDNVPDIDTDFVMHKFGLINKEGRNAWAIATESLPNKFKQERDKFIKDLTQKFMFQWGRENNKDVGNMITGMGPLTNKGKEEFIQKFKKQAEDVTNNIENYIDNLKDEPPTEGWENRKSLIPQSTQAKREAITKEEVSLPQKAPEPPISEGEKGDIPRPTTEKTAEVGQEIIKPENNFTIDEKGSVILPSRELISDTVTKMKSVWDVEAPFVKAGANETGFRVKNYYSEIETGLTRGTELIQSITSQGRKTGLKDTDYSEVTYATESPVYRMKLDGETRNKIEPIVKEVNEFYKGWEEKLKEIGWMEEPFPQSLLSRNNKLIDNYKDQLKNDLSKDQKTKIQKSIADLQAQNQKIKDLDLQFVSVPIRMIIEGADTAVGKHFMSILPHWGRKTLTIKDLVDEGVLTPEQADIRNIVAEYSDRMSRKYALGQIFKSAEEDGLITQASEKPEWSEFSAKIIPQLKGKVLHPAFNDMLNAYFGVTYSTGIAKAYETVVGITKMMQFYNPVFLPMYDAIQGFAAGTFTSKNTPQSIKQALNDIPITIGKIHRPASENYIEAMENGLFSQPFVINYKTYTEQIKDILSNQKFKEATSKLGKNPVMGLYQLSWNTAWKGDQIVRMMTYNHLKNSGMDSREAAQVAAKFHGDYASVPPSTRKLLNKFFFTPTFKITMTKLYEDMAKGVVKTAFSPRAAESKEKTYAKGLLLSFAFLEGRRYFMTHVLGYEEEQRYRRYVKEVETDEGMKESVITVADPLNIPWRYYYRGKSAIDDPDLNKVSKLFDQLKYDMTPLMRVGFELVENRYENVYKEGDDADRQLGSAALFVTKELIGITKPLIEAQEKPDEFKTESWKVMQKELGTLNSLIMQPFVFHYARDTKDKRLSLAIYRLQNNFKMALRTSESPEQQQRIVSNFYTELEKLQKELDEYYSKK